MLAVAIRASIAASAASAAFGCGVLGGAPDAGPALVRCKAPTIRAGAQADECTIELGACDDKNTYALRCRDLNLGGVGDDGMDCLCDVDGVVGSELADDIGVSDTSCASASALPAGRFERAWHQCGVDMTIGSG